MNMETKFTQSIKKSLYEKEQLEEVEPAKAVTSRILAGLIDILILLALKNIINIFGTKFELLIVPIYYIICLFKYSTTIGGVIFGIKIVEKTSKKTNIRFPHVVIRSLIVSLVTAIVYYSYMNLISTMQYLIPAILTLFYINPIFFTKKRLTIHDYASQSKVIKYKVQCKYLIKRSVLIFFSAILIVSLFALLDSKCKQAVDDKDYNNEGFFTIKVCSATTHAKYDQEDYYKIGVSLLKKGKGRSATKFLRKAAKLGQRKADILLIQSYSLSNQFRQAEAQTAKMIKDLAATLTMSNMFISKYENSKDPKDIYKAYIYLNIYYILYSQDTLKNSVMAQSERKNILSDYYVVATRYIKIAEDILSDEEIKKAQATGISLLSGIK